MIDLSKNQILEPAVKCWFKDDNGKFVEGELLSIDHRVKFYPFTVRIIGDFEAIIYAEEVVLEDPNKQELMTREQVMGFLANESGILVRHIHDNGSWELPDSFNYTHGIINFEWVKVDIDGNFLTEPSKFWRK